MRQINSAQLRHSCQNSCTQKHDKLGWTHSAVFPAPYGLCGVRSNNWDSLVSVIEEYKLGFSINSHTDPITVDKLYSLRVAPASRSAGTRHYHVVYEGCQPRFRTFDLADATRRLAYAVQESLGLEVARATFPGKMIATTDYGNVLVVGSPEELSTVIPATSTEPHHDMVHLYSDGLFRWFSPPWHRGAFNPLAINRPPSQIERAILLTSGEWDFQRISTSEAVVRLLDFAPLFPDPRQALKIISRWASNATFYIHSMTEIMNFHKLTTC